MLDLDLIASTSAPTPELPAWMLPVAAVAAVVCWWLHCRWRDGRYFMSRFTTHEREAPKFAEAGYVFLPAAIGSTAITTMFALWTIFGLVASPWFVYLFLALGAVFLIAAGWAVKEFWAPTKRRTPDWVRRL